MKVLSLLEWYLYITSFYCHAHAFNATQVSKMQELLEHYCPYHNPFTCGVGNSSETPTNMCCSGIECSKIHDNPNMKGCSCDQSCGRYNNCCYEDDDKYHLIEEGIMKCMFPYTGPYNHALSNNMYKIIVGPPQGGCKAPGSCNGSSELIPWKTFYPVFSNVTKQSYIHADCAACHGIQDTTKWISMIHFNRFNFLDMYDIIDTLMDGESFQTFFSFIHPGTDREIRQSLCSKAVTDECRTSDKETGLIFVNRVRKILPHLQITFDEMRNGCFHGPYSSYLQNNVLYKNIFCVFCKSRIPLVERCSLRGSRNPHSSFSTLMNYDFTDMASKHGRRERTSKKSQIACKVGTKRECRPVLCPAMQMRVKTGECKFVSTRWHLSGLKVTLNLTTAVSMTDEDHLFSNSTESTVLGVLHENTPWHQCWTIETVSIRSFLGRITPMTELVIMMACKRGELDPSKLITYLQETISRVWTIKTGSGILRFNQEVFKYKGLVRYIDNSTGLNKMLRPTDLDGIADNVSTIVETPHYLTIIPRSRGFLKGILIITKLLLCHQVELKPHAYEIYRRAEVSIPKLISPSKFLYGNEVLVRKILNYTIVRLCLEDFDMEIVPNGVRAENISGILIIAGLLCIYN